MHPFAADTLKANIRATQSRMRKNSYMQQNPMQQQHNMQQQMDEILKLKQKRQADAQRYRAQVMHEESQQPIESNMRCSRCGI